MEYVIVALAAMLAGVGTGLVGLSGSSLLPGLGKALSQKTGLRVVISDDPLDAVIKGLGRIAKKPTLLADPLNYRRR